jgi:hypothetical protein
VAIVLVVSGLVVSLFAAGGLGLLVGYKMKRKHPSAPILAAQKTDNQPPADTPSPQSPPDGQPAAETPPAKEEPKPSPAEAPESPPTPPNPKWIDARKGLWKWGNLRVMVGGGFIDKVSAYDSDIDKYVRTREPMISIGITIKSLEETIRTRYKGWGIYGCSLEDNFGNVYQRVCLPKSYTLGPNGEDFQVDQRTINPGKVLYDVLLFEEPIDKATSFHLTLPGDHIIGIKEDIHFFIPRSLLPPLDPPAPGRPLFPRR